MDKIDTDKEILKFIVDSKNSGEKEIKDIRVHRDTVCSFHLINDGEYIETAANEMPNRAGGWSYIDLSTYDYVYFVVDEKLVSITFICDIESCDTRRIILRSYPNAMDYTIQTKNGHRNKPYVQFIGKDGKAINDYYFEISKEDFSDFNGLRLIDIINPLTSKELEDRYNKRYSKELNR